MFYLFLTLSLFFLAAAAFFNAHMDVVKDHFSVSIYAKLDPQWYNPSVSWTNKNNVAVGEGLQIEYLPFWVHPIIYLKPVWSPLSDFWHWNKTKMITSLIFYGATALLTGYYSESLRSTPLVLLSTLAGYVAFGSLLWDVVFNFFYNRKLAK